MTLVTGMLVLFGGIALMNLYALVLVLLRGPLFGTRVYRPMVLNIGLSLTPVLVLVATIVTLVLVVTVAPSRAALIVVIVVGGLIWLALLPNGAYLVTELNFSHRREDDVVPLWYDILLVLSLALSGVLNTLANVLLAQLVFVLIAHVDARDPYTSPDSWIIAAVVLLLVSIGIYLGRYLRFNSWDLLHPASFARKLGDHFREHGRWRAAVGFSVAHTILLALLYLVVVAPVLILF